MHGYGELQFDTPSLERGAGVRVQEEVGSTMEAIGWISIVIGVLHFRKVSGILLIIAGIAVVYVMRKSRKDEHEFAHRLLQTQIRRTRRGIARLRRTRDFTVSDLRTLPNPESKGKNSQKPDWFIYTN